MTHEDAIALIEASAADVFCREILRLRESIREMRGKLQLLVEAVDPFLADQGGAADSRCGLVQPVSVAECNELNEAVKAAWELLERT